MNKTGKTLTIFIVLFIIILVSSTSIGFFLYHQERNARHDAESNLQRSQDAEAKSQADLKELKRQLVLLQDKNKEADDKINGLLDEMELNEGLRNELKKENESVKTQMEALSKDKDKLKIELEDAQKKIKEIQDLYDAAKTQAKSLQDQLTAAQQAKSLGEGEPKLIPVEKVELDKIVVNPAQSGIKGRIVSVDKDSEFVICNIGLKQGVKAGDMLSVYRGEEYLGDVKATRVQDQLCAADIIPPFSSHKVRKNDIVMVKPQ